MFPLRVIVCWLSLRNICKVFPPFRILVFLFMSMGDFLPDLSFPFSYNSKYWEISLAFGHGFIFLVVCGGCTHKTIVMYSPLLGCWLPEWWRGRVEEEACLLWRVFGFERVVIIGVMGKGYRGILDELFDFPGRGLLLLGPLWER